MNRALSETGAEWFVAWACDDVMQPGNLARKIAAAEQAGAGFVSSTSDLIDETGAKVGMEPDHAATPAVVAAPEFFARIAPRNAVSCQSVLARVDALRAIGGFDGRSFYAGDWLTWMRLALRWPVATIAEPLIANRVHAQAGTQASNASGLNGRDIPITLDRVFLDEAMPAPWQAWRDPMVAVAHADVAADLSSAGLRRVSDGWAAYMVMGRALARQPQDAGLIGSYLALVQAAGLQRPSLPCEAVAAAPQTEQEAVALGAAAAELGPLLAQLSVAVDPDGLDAVMALLEPVFGASAP